MAGGGLRIGAGFSADGETLYAAGQGTEMQVAAVNADDGTVLASREGPHIYEADLLVDWQGRYVFVVGIRERRTLLMVLDAQSLETIAEIHAPDEDCDPYQAGGSNQVGLVQDQTQNRVYAVWATQEWQFELPANSCIQRFDLR
jgi:hypothetical protein